MIQEQEKYVINYNSMILFQLVQFFFDISVVFVCMQDPSSVGIKKYTNHAIEHILCQFVNLLNQRKKIAFRLKMYF